MDGWLPVAGWEGWMVEKIGRGSVWDMYREGVRDWRVC